MKLRAPHEVSPGGRSSVPSHRSRARKILLKNRKRILKKGNLFVIFKNWDESEICSWLNSDANDPSFQLMTDDEICDHIASEAFNQRR